MHDQEPCNFGHFSLKVLKSKKLADEIPSLSLAMIFSIMFSRLHTGHKKSLVLSRK